MRYPACFGETFLLLCKEGSGCGICGEMQLVETFPLLCKEGSGEVESSPAPPGLHGREALPHLPSPYKGEAWTFSFSLPLSGRGRGNRLPESRASGLFSGVGPVELLCLSGPCFFGACFHRYEAVMSA